MAKHNVGVVGGTGYAGAELVRLLINHPNTSLKVITSQSQAGKLFSTIHPQFSNLVDLRMQPVEKLAEYNLDIVFLALPHGVSMNFIKEHGIDTFRIVDLSGDFRLPTAASYEEWYHKKHVAPDFIEQAAFGLPELFRNKVRNAKLVANPGCYPTSAIFPLAPLLDAGLIETGSITIDAKSGVTGAGSSATKKTHFPEVFGNFSAYGLLRHRHTPEIQEALKKSTGEESNILFTPHLLPVDRGIFTTIYSKPTKKVSKEVVQETVAHFYGTEHFIRIVDAPPMLKHVRGSNYCDIFTTYDERTQTIISISTIDNLMKGAAGQAVQNMNIMLGLIEQTGLEITPLSP